MRSEERIDAFLNALGREWKRQGVDLRFGQFLFNNGIEDTSGSIYYLEESTLLESMFPEINPREYKMWGSYGKDGKQPFKFSTIMSLSTNHIKAILKSHKMGMHVSTEYVKLFEDELKYRKSDKYLKKK